MRVYVFRISLWISEVAYSGVLLYFIDLYIASVYHRCMVLFVFFKQKTAYEMRISDWSSDVCSSDLSASSRASRGDDSMMPLNSSPRSTPEASAWLN